MISLFAWLAYQTLEFHHFFFHWRWPFCSVWPSILMVSKLVSIFKCWYLPSGSLPIVHFDRFHSRSHLLWDSLWIFPTVNYTKQVDLRWRVGGGGGGGVPPPGYFRDNFGGFPNTLKALSLNCIQLCLDTFICCFAIPKLLTYREV